MLGVPDQPLVRPAAVLGGGQRDAAQLLRALRRAAAGRPRDPDQAEQQSHGPH